MTGKKTGTSSKDEGYLSDESDFYGDVSTKAMYEERASEFDPSSYWSDHTPSLTEMADKNVANEALSVPKAAATLYNPYSGQRSARQLNESIPEFLERLPPETTHQTASIPWIFVANPYRKAPNVIAANEEAPPGEDSSWGEFAEEANDLLRNLVTLRNSIKLANAGKPPSSITRLVNKEKDSIVRQILDAAIEHRCTTGKWMLFCPPDEVNEVWARIATATSTNSLGIAAKVAPIPAEGEISKVRVICIYTSDFSDISDVIKVLKTLKELGMVDQRGKAIYYKCDAYTYLGLNSTNEYGIKASLYNSIDIMKKSPPPSAAKSTRLGTNKNSNKTRSSTIKEDGKLDGFFYKSKSNADDWEILENE